MNSGDLYPGYETRDVEVQGKVLYRLGRGF